MAGIFYAANPRPFVTFKALQSRLPHAPNSPTLFVTLSTNTTDQTGITFDHVGTFGFNMIVTTENGVVWQVQCNPQNSCSTGIPTLIGRTGTELEGPAVVPRDFRPYGGQFMAADENNGAVHAIDRKP